MGKIVLELREVQIDLHHSRRLLPTPHIHKEIELVYVEKGSALCCADKKFFQIMEGDMFLCFSNQVHYYLNSEMGTYYVLIFSPDILHNMKELFSKNYPESNLVRNSDNALYGQLIRNIYAAEGKFCETTQVGLLNQLMPMLVSGMKLKTRFEATSPTLQNILDFCTQNFANNITLDDVSEALHLSKYHISHLLNQKLSIGFNHYLNTLRIYEACNLMEDTTKNLTFISEEVGFGSIRSFNRAFMQIMNTTPHKYQKQIRSEKT